MPALRVTVDCCDALPGIEGQETCDPYVVLKLGTVTHKTDIQKRCTKPIFGDDFSLPAPNLTDELEVSVWDYNHIPSNVMLCSTKIPLTKFTTGASVLREFEDWYDLQLTEDALNLLKKIKKSENMVLPSPAVLLRITYDPDATGDQPKKKSAFHSKLARAAQVAQDELANFLVEAQSIAKDLVKEKKLDGITLIISVTTDFFEVQLDVDLSLPPPPPPPSYPSPGATRGSIALVSLPTETASSQASTTSSFIRDIIGRGLSQLLSIQTKLQKKGFSGDCSCFLKAKVPGLPVTAEVKLGFQLHITPLVNQPTPDAKRWAMRQMSAPINA